MICRFCGSRACPRALRPSLNCYGFPAGIGVAVGDIHPWRGDGPDPNISIYTAEAVQAHLRDVQENGT